MKICSWPAASLTGMPSRSLAELSSELCLEHTNQGVLRAQSRYTATQRHTCAARAKLADLGCCQDLKSSHCST